MGNKWNCTKLWHPWKPNLSVMIKQHSDISWKCKNSFDKFELYSFQGTELYETTNLNTVKKLRNNLA